MYNKILTFCKRSYSSHKHSIQYVLNTRKSGENIKIQGWVKSIRKMKECTFIDVGDGNCANKLQVIIENDLKPKALSAGSSVAINGNLNITHKGQLELKATAIDVLGECNVTDGYPFAPKKTYAADYIRQYLHLRPRTNKFSSLLRVRDAATFAIHEHLHEKGFINVNTPILTSNDCEGAGELFTVYPENKAVLKNMLKPGIPIEEAYFDNKVFLSVSAQLHLEAVSHGISKVYTLGPTFRAENSRSRLHLSEFYMLEAEIAFVDGLQQVMSIIESLIKDVTAKIMNKSHKDLTSLHENDLDFAWTEKSFPIITYDDAVALLKKENSEFNPEKGFTKENEMWLVKYCGNVPTFVINWPKNEKPFYMKECSDDDTKVAALDLLAPNVGEIVGGSLRENDYQKLKNKLPGENLNWYLELRKFGSVPTGGFGLGFERYLQFISGVNNIKDTIPFPRWPHNCKL